MTAPADQPRASPVRLLVRVVALSVLCALAWVSVVTWGEGIDVALYIVLAAAITVGVLMMTSYDQRTGEIGAWVLLGSMFGGAAIQGIAFILWPDWAIDTSRSSTKWRVRTPGGARFLGSFLALTGVGVLLHLALTGGKRRKRRPNARVEQAHAAYAKAKAQHDELQEHYDGGSRPELAEQYQDARDALGSATRALWALGEQPRVPRKRRSRRSPG